MEDKKVKAGSVAVGICLFVIAILLVLIIVFFYNTTIEKNNLQAKVSELETTIKEKDNKVNELENKISKVSDVLNGEEKLLKEEDKITEKDLIGTFFPMESWPGDAPYIIIEENGKIQLCGNATEYGSYEIDGNEVNVVYSLREGPEANEEVRENRKEKITVINDNVIKTTAIINNETYIVTYVRQEICDEIEEKAKKCIDNQDALKVDYMGIYQINEDNCIFGAYLDSKLSYIVFDTSDSNMYKISEVKDEI